MGRIVVFNNVTLDGVMQAPARADEDTRDGFSHGGWSNGYQDETLGRIVGGGMATAGALLLGRRTYEDFFAIWPHRTDNPFTDVLNRTTKYVASRTLTEPLPWENSVLLPGDAAEALADVKEDKDLVVLGSGELIASLRRADLVDAYTLLIHPILLGSGRKLFDGVQLPRTLRLTQATPTTTGVIVAQYERR
jgi:dihydrofolate reductase